MGCIHAHKERRCWFCSISGEQCVFQVPDLSICSRLYDEGQYDPVIPDERDPHWDLMDDDFDI